MKVVIAGGGTAGHVNPALALAEALAANDVVFVGTDSGAEARLVAEAGHDLRTIDVAGFDRARKWALPLVAARAARAIATSRRLLRALKPDVVVGMGGYVSLPVCLAARTLRIPVVLHEQNIVLGLANKVCRRVATKIAVSFADTVPAAGERAIYTGNPISSAIAGVDKERARAAGLETFELERARKTALVFGGSLGAERLNDAAIGVAELWRDRDDVQIVHICGPRNSTKLQARLPDGYGRLIYRLVPYVDDMAQAYAVADVAVCRGGATTVAEICALGLPSVIVPYPHHRDMQQLKHARVLERDGAAVVLEDARATPQKVAHIVDELLGDESRLQTMAAAAKALGRPDAAERLAQVVREVA